MLAAAVFGIPLWKLTGSYKTVFLLAGLASNFMGSLVN